MGITIPGPEPMWITAFGPIHMLSIIYLRAERMQKKFGRDLREYLDKWAQIQFEAGRDIQTHEEAISPFLRLRARRACIPSPTNSYPLAGDSKPEGPTP